MKTKNIVYSLITCVLGVWFTWSGVQDYQNGKRLVASGKATTAQVIGRSVSYRLRSGNRYYLSVQFQTEAGQSLRERVEVNHAAYLEAATGGTVSLRYLASDPAICAVGEAYPAWRGSLFSGAILLVSGGLLATLGRRRLSTREAAEKIVAHVGALCESQYEYAPVNASDFNHLDLNWYGASQRWLEERGFALLGDEENLTFRRTSKGNRILLRTMLGRDGTCLAYLYHFKPATLAGNGLKVLELQTQLANRTFICTSNAEAAGKLDSPPGVDAQRLTANSPFDAIMASHFQRLATCLANNPGLATARLGSLEEVHRAQNVLQQMKAAYRQDTGITKEELKRLAGNRLDAGQIEHLHSEVQKLHADRQQNAA